MINVIISTDIGHFNYVKCPTFRFLTGTFVVRWKPGTDLYKIGKVSGAVPFV